MWYSDLAGLLKMKTSQLLSNVIFCLILVAFFYGWVQMDPGSHISGIEMGLGFFFLYILVLPVYVLASCGVVLQTMVFARRNWSKQLGPFRAALVVSALAGALATFGLLRLQVNAKPSPGGWIGHFWIQWLFLTTPWFLAGWVALCLWPFQAEKEHAGSILVDFP